QLTDSSTRHLQLNTAAPVVLALSQCWTLASARLRHCSRRSLHNEHEMAFQALAILWRSHTSFRGLLLIETRLDVWAEWTMDPFAPGNLGHEAFRSGNGSDPNARVAVQFERVKAGSGARRASALAALRARNLGGGPVHTNFPNTEEYVSATFNDTNIIMVGRMFRLFTEIKRHLNCRLVFKEGLTEEDQSRVIKFKTEAGNYYSWLGQVYANGRVVTLLASPERERETDSFEQLAASALPLVAVSGNDLRSVQRVPRGVFPDAEAAARRRAANT
ncbi:Protein of unknown function, partial [Gryllus bimaculatus]